MMDVIFKSSEHTAARMDFAGLAADAAASITGTALPVDGGWTAR
jgi:hypothetical protein